MLPNGLVSVRDGAFSSFETSKLIEEFIPVQGLKVIFLYVLFVCMCFMYKLPPLPCCYA